MMRAVAAEVALQMESLQLNRSQRVGMQQAASTDTQLSSAISLMNNTMMGIDASLAASIAGMVAAEHARAVGVEGSLSSKIFGETSRAMAIEASLAVTGIGNFGEVF